MVWAGLFAIGILMNDVIAPLLPEGELLYPEDDISDRPVRFFVEFHRRPT